MDSSQKHLGSMDAKMPLLLFVTQAKKPMAACPLQDATLLASAWALVTAGLFAVSYALGSQVVDALCIQQLPWCDFREENAVERSLRIGLWCCAVLQAATAALALLLPCRRHRRIRRAVAYLAVAVAIVSHCILASLVLLSADAGLGYLLLIPLIVYAAAALVLLLPCRCLRIRHALACLTVAVAVAILGCCILASFVPIAADTGLGWLILSVVGPAFIFTLAVGDLSFLALLRGGEFPWEFR
ncbi:uncharacterized protein [Triticum aestivum]|uniref:uncharacterized protein n=1 Tax=Triticum aestivum TaxID=4565 RepID=UPI001D026B80|nr:uncharacterized protein LOC123098008 [Triticum aestivum]XP_044375821.1 uncharacterized protein LOC123098008 [Triticum aestivum]